MHPFPRRARRSPYSHSIWRLGLLATALLATLALALTAGAYDVSPARLARALVDGPPGASLVPDLPSAIVWKVRLPRIVLALFVGAALATAGAVYQAAFRNPLVEPYILGVSSGAAFGAALGIVVPAFPLSVQLSAFAGALVAVTLVRRLSPAGSGGSVVLLVLSGLVVGSMFGAGVSALKYVAHDTALRDIVFWLMGGLYFATWHDTAVVGPVVALSILVMACGGWRLNVLSVGDDEAQALGVDPRRARRTLLGAATLATAVSVASVGIVPWIGMMTPHAARMIVGQDNRLVVPASALLGGALLLGCDTAARSLTTAEIPVGIVTALAGGPFLAFLLRRRGAGMVG